MIGLSGRYHNALFAACIFAGLLLSWLFSDHQLLTGDQTQMLYKGYLGAYEGSGSAMAMRRVRWVMCRGVCRPG